VSEEGVPNGVPLRDYLQAQLDAMQQQMDRRIAHLEETVKITEAAHVRALDKADTALNQRLEGMNEIRAQLGVQRAEFATRDQLDSLGATMRALHDAALAQIDSAVAPLRDRLTAMQASNSSLNGRITLLTGLLITMITVLLFAVGLLINHVITP
jgi:chromosome segregation ATPase